MRECLHALTESLVLPDITQTPHLNHIMFSDAQLTQAFTRTVVDGAFPDVISPDPIVLASNWKIQGDPHIYGHATGTC